MEKAYFVTLAIVLLTVAGIAWIRLFRGPRQALHYNAKSNVRNERIASQLLVLYLSLGALAATLGIAALFAA